MPNRVIHAAAVGALTGGAMLAFTAVGYAQVADELGIARAEARPLAADRPDFTEAASTVGRGVVQIEFGYTFGLDRSDGILLHAHSLGELLMRLGVLAEGLELRVAASPMEKSVDSEGIRASETGVEDLYLGVKLELSRQQSLVPATALVPQMTVPTGSARFSSERVLPGVNLVYSWETPGGLSVAGSTQVNLAVADGGDSYPEWAQSAVAGAGLGARAGVYAEWFAFLRARDEDTPTDHYVNAGVTWLSSDDFQWDLRVGVGLNDAAEDVFGGVGASVRIR